jgi:ferritin
MLSPRMTDRLNEQLNREFFSSNLYLQMSAWAEAEGLDGCAAFLSKHADEEMAHMRRFFTYINQTGAMAVVGALEAPPTKFKDVKQLFEKIYEHECHITRCINEITQAAFAEPDMTTFNFMQWFVAEQHEEETLVRNILDRIKVIGLDGKGVYFIDQEVQRFASGEAGPAEPGEGAGAT